MCGCAVELNMNSFISARQKDTPNTDEAQALMHAHTYTQMHTWFLFHFILPYLVKDTLKDFSGGILSIPREMRVHQLLFLVRRQE